MNPSVKKSPNTATTPEAEELVQCLDVARDAGHEAAHRILVVEAQVEPLELAEDFRSQVVHDPLAQPGREDGLGVEQDEAEHDRPEVCGGERGQQRCVAIRNRVVQGNPGQPGPDDLEKGSGHEDGDGQSDVAPIRPEVLEKPPHQAGVVPLSERLFFLEAVLRWRHFVLPSVGG